MRLPTKCQNIFKNGHEILSEASSREKDGKLSRCSRVFTRIFCILLREEAFVCISRRAQWPEPVKPEPNGFVADVHAAFVHWIFNVSNRKWVTNIHHNRQADHLG
jgi:hypothetical protein